MVAQAQHLRSTIGTETAVRFIAFLNSITGFSTPLPGATLVNSDESRRPVTRPLSSDARSRATTALNILVVEDETIVALDLMATLEQLGHNPTGHALSGEEALAEICAQRPDLVLMDIRIQGDLDGIQTAQRIRNAYGIPIIFLTAFSDPNTTQRAEDAGMAGLLRKPFSRQQLQEALHLIQQKPQ